MFKGNSCHYLLVLARGMGQFSRLVNKALRHFVIFEGGTEESFEHGHQTQIDHHFIRWGRMHECVNGTILHLEDVLITVCIEIKSSMPERGKEAHSLGWVEENFGNRVVE